MNNSIKLTLGYNQSEFTRNMTIGNVADSIASDSATVKEKIRAINESIAGGTDDGLVDFFRADDYDGTGGTFAGITAAQIVSTDVTVIDLSAADNTSTEEEGE